MKIDYGWMGGRGGNEPVYWNHRKIHRLFD